MASAGVLGESRPDGILPNTAASAVWITACHLPGTTEVKWHTQTETRAAGENS